MEFIELERGRPAAEALEVDGRRDMVSSLMADALSESGSLVLGALFFL